MRPYAHAVRNGCINDVVEGVRPRGYLRKTRWDRVKENVRSFGMSQAQLWTKED